MNRFKHHLFIKQSWFRLDDCVDKIVFNPSSPFFQTPNR
ncbi:hypothetical protein BOVA514_4323 [Bacteroides ovatus]|nr:hypothetical protein BOVA514_4323 [Bacteroides ovatus]